jgi:hypothetical protein
MLLPAAVQHQVASAHGSCTFFSCDAVQLLAQFANVLSLEDGHASNMLAMNYSQLR